MPSGSLVWHLVAGFGADRVAGMVVSVHLAVGRDGGGLVDPVGAGGWVGGDRAERGDGPGGRGLGGVLAEPAGAVVHQGRDADQVSLPGGVGQAGNAAGPGALRLGEQGFDAVADTGVEDGGDVAGSGQLTGGDGGAEDVGGVQAGQFVGVQGAVQPAGPVGEGLAVAGRQRGGDQVAVAVVAGGGGLGGPDGVQGSEVVGVGQVALPGRGGGLLGSVAAEDVGEHGDRLALTRPVRAAG